MNSNIFVDLRNALANLYTDKVNIVRLVADAGIDGTRVDFDHAAINIWHGVLVEAAKVNRINALLDIVEDEYGSNVEFLTACVAYRKSYHKHPTTNDDLSTIATTHVPEQATGHGNIPAGSIIIAQGAHVNAKNIVVGSNIEINRH